MRMTQNRLGLLLVILIIAAGSLAAQTSPRIVYAGGDTTLNGNLLYQAAALKAGDKVQTGSGGTKITLGDSELELSPDTLVVIGSDVKSIEVLRGRVKVISGNISVSETGATTTLTAGQSTTASAPTGGALPDAPSATREPEPPSPVSRRRQYSAGVAASGRGGLGLERQSGGWAYWTLTSAMFASSIVNAEYANKCIDQNSCTSIPDPFRSRAAMYGAGLPAEAGVAYLTAYLKGKGKRWWFVPAAAVTAGNIYVAHHWSTRLR